MGFFDKLKEEKERKEAEKREAERRSDLESEMQGIALNVETAVNMNDDYWLNDLIDRAYELNKAEPWLEVPAIIVRADETMREHDRRIVDIKEKYTLSQWLEAEKEVRLEIDEEDDE